MNYILEAQTGIPEGPNWGCALLALAVVVLIGGLCAVIP